MKALIVSDTHRRDAAFYEVVKMHQPDMVIHCGDTEGSEQALEDAAHCPVYIVTGNNDYFSLLPSEREIEVCGYKIWITHGHHYYVSMGSEAIKREAIARGVDIVCYGHTHRPVVERDDEVIAVNPGSLSYPRQENRRPSYLIMEIDNRERLHFTIAYL